MQFALTESQFWSITIACVMMVLDVVVGFATALSNNTFSSSKMRVGLCHKMLLLCIIFMSYIIELAGEHISGFEFSSVSVIAICGYIIVMEVGSVLENILKAYPELKDLPLFKLFGIDKKD